jgi:hypothetical protein
MTTREIVSKGLADVAHTVEDSPYLRAIMAAALSEREAMIRTGQVMLECVRIASRQNRELQVVVDLAERVFGEDV